jgi:hypothetical protein
MGQKLCAKRTKHGLKAHALQGAELLELLPHFPERLLFLLKKFLGIGDWKLIFILLEKYIRGCGLGGNFYPTIFDGVRRG